MMINFLEISEIAFLISLGEVLVLNNVIVDEHNFGEFITSTYDS